VRLQEQPFAISNLSLVFCTSNWRAKKPDCKSEQHEAAERINRDV
jgi:hypothetical protein